MVKAHFKKMLILGINRQEMEHLTSGQPLHIKLDDLDPRLKGQFVVIIPGETDEQLAKAAKEAERLMQEAQKQNRITLVS